MKRTIFACLIVAVYMLPIRLSIAVDVNGPFINAQSAVEYTTFVEGGQTITWLYALNAKDIPKQYDPNSNPSSILFLSRMTGTSGAWIPNSIVSNQQVPIFNDQGFPSILGSNRTFLDDDSVCMTIGAYVASEFLGVSKRNAPSSGLRWFDRQPGFFNDGQEDRYTRLVVGRRYPRAQWMGCLWQGTNTWEQLATTSDGWVSATNFGENLFPGDKGVYSLAIDDRATPQQAFLALTDDPLGTTNDPHSQLSHCSGLYSTTNSGFGWAQITPPGWTADMYNVQVAMMPVVHDNENDNYLVYVLGLERPTAGATSVYCRWALWTGGTSFTWHTSDPGAIVTGNENIPVFPYDLVVEWDNTSESFYLYAATSQKIYFASHNGSDSDIDWTERMGSGTDVIKSLGFRDITVLATDRSRSVAVAGEVCSYFTSDAGLSWHEIANTGALVDYPDGGACQSGSQNIVSLHVGTRYTDQSHLAPVYIETAPHQDGPTSDGAFTKTVQLGYTWTGSRGQTRVAVMNDGTYLAIWPDSLTSYDNGNTIGICYRSTDQGETWSPSVWTGREFGRETEFESNPAPVVSNLYASPQDGIAYVTFRNAGGGTGTGEIPALAFTIDGGATWTSRLGNQALQAWGEKPVASSSYGSTRKVYVTFGGSINVSSDDGQTWFGVLAPAGFGNISSISTRWLAPDYLAISNGSYTEIKPNATSGWIQGNTFGVPFSYALNQIWSDPEYAGILWGSFQDANNTGNQILGWTSNYGRNWRTISEWISNSTHFGSGGPESTSLYLETDAFVTQEGWTRRPIWTATSINSIGYLPSAPNPSTGIRYFEFRFLPPPERIPRYYAVSSVPGDLPLIVPTTTTIGNGDTLVINPGVEVYVAAGCTLNVKGTLLAGSNSGGLTKFLRLDDGADSLRWSGIVVTGKAVLENCELSGAVTGIETSKANTLSLSNCTISDCGTGLVAYQPSGTGVPQFDDCHIVGNEHDGISFLSVANAGIDNCEISNNGGDGLVMTNSYAKITSSEFVDNGDAEGGHGLVCFGSSPFMACNNFESSQKGEVALYNQSYPLMDKNAGAGENSFFNEDHNLIEMWDSYPLTSDGHNNFTVGSSGYFMADMSSSPKKRDISGNYWNPTLSLATLYPSSSSVYTWSSTDQTASSCGTTSGSSSNATQQMFASAIADQSEGDYAASNSILNDVIEAYPDSEWSVAAVAMLFANQCLIGDGYSTLQADLDGVVEEFDSTDLARTAESFATRLLVEDEQFSPAIETYASELAGATNATDSLFAQVDLAVTQYRADQSGGSLDEMNAADIKDVLNQVGTLSSSAPASPTASHQGYSVIPNTISLENNFPNPFNAETTIRFYLPEATRAEVAVYNIVGQKVVTLTDEFMTAGFHNVKWAAGDYASGVYLYQLKANGVVETKKMVLIK